MITKMTKYDFLVFHAQYDAFLEKLRNVGVLHVATLEDGGDNLELIREKIALQARIDKQIETASALVDAYHACKDNPPLTLAPAGNLTLDEGLALLDSFEALQNEANALRQDVVAAEREQQRMAPWGDYSAEQFQRLADAGFRLGFYTCAGRLYKPEWEEQYNAFIVNNSTNTRSGDTTICTCCARAVQNSNRDALVLRIQCGTVKSYIILATAYESRKCHSAYK